MCWEGGGTRDMTRLYIITNVRQYVSFCFQVVVMMDRRVGKRVNIDTFDSH